MTDRLAPFENSEGRLMVSLGPLTAHKYCTYSCPFCYVRADYQSFASMKTEDIVEWVALQSQEEYDAIYISGDTDSFAPPRQARAVELLAELVQFGVDLLFTTRAKLETDTLREIARIATKLSSADRFLYGCVSISQFSVPRLEPPPIPHPTVRAKQLRQLADSGAVAILALRPFLPIVPTTDYARILEAGGDQANLVLGEDWFADDDGILESVVIGESPLPETAVVTRKAMTFDANNATWRVYQLPEHEHAVRELCSKLNLPFFMRSRPALEYWRNAHGPAKRD